MTFFTLQYGSVEKTLADWNITNPVRECANQAHDHIAFDVLAPAAEADPFPYGAQITVRLGRTAQGGAGVPPDGLPPGGNTKFTGGKIFFVGWRVENFRTGATASEKLEYKFAGPWEFFFERLVFQKLWWTWNGSANVADWRSQIILGLSANALVGAGDTVPGTSATNLMSISQQIREIVGYVVWQTVLAYGTPQLQLDGLTAGGDGVYRPNWDVDGNYQLYATPGASALAIPDFIAGAYEASGLTSVTALQSANAPGTLALANTVLRAPLDSVNDITCAEACRRMLRWIGAMGDPVVWFDYTTTPPTLHISTKDLLPSIALPFPPTPSITSPAAPLTGPNGPMYAQAGKIKRRDDLIPAAVQLFYRITGAVGSQEWTQVIRDIAGTIGGAVYEGIGMTDALYTLDSYAGGSPSQIASGTQTALQNLGQGFAAQVATLDFQGAAFNTLQCKIATLATNFADPTGVGASTAFWLAVLPDLADWSGLAFAPGAAVTITDDNGSTTDSSSTAYADYGYLLTDGQIAPWMLNGNTYGGTPVKCAQVTISAAFGGTGQITNGVTNPVPIDKNANAPKRARVTLCTIPGGLYTQNFPTSLGEQVPFGLAGYIYNIAKIPQYEGAYTIQEDEITDQCPLGYNLNLTDALSEWDNMQACVQQIIYDLASGRTTLTFGPAAHLGAKDFVERLRVNRGPRWFNLNGNNVTNAQGMNGAAQLGNNVAQRGPSPGPPAKSLQIYPVSLSDLDTSGAAYASAGYGVPGITHDPLGAINYGGISGLGTPSQPTIMLAAGGGGTLTSTALIRISTADMGGKGPAYFQPVQVCVSGAWKTAYVLMTVPS